MRADQTRWDARHATAGADRPDPPVAASHCGIVLPVAGRALDIACGRGGVAVWLALRGMTVDALDVSPVALRATRDLARHHGVQDLVTFTQWDLEAGLPNDARFDVLTCQRFRAPGLYPQLTAALTPGGTLVISVLSEVGGRPGPFAARPGELADEFGALGLTVVRHQESDGLAHLVARAPG